ncbi:MAG TPA: L-threonylcarbamoyladenylate synthase [Polyangiales bacterium]
MFSAEQIAHAVRVLRAGGVVACPTETFVGLLADARSAQAVQHVCELKGRDPNNPIGVLVADARGLDALARELPPRARALAARYWPGPLTLVVRAVAGLPPELQKDGKIGVRVPGPSLALDLVRAFGGPLTATSANLTGQPPARTSVEARAVFGKRLDFVVDGESPGGLASTVVDVTTDPVTLLRRGAIDVAVS